MRWVRGRMRLGDFGREDAHGPESSFDGGAVDVH